MTPFRSAHSDAEDWSGIAKNLADGLSGEDPGGDEARLGFIYVTDAVADDFGSILTYLR